MNPVFLKDIFKEANASPLIFNMPVSEMTISSADGSMEVLLEHDSDISQDELDRAVDAIKEAYGIDRLFLRLSQGENKPPEELILDKLEEQYPALAKAVERESFSLQDNTLLVRISENWTCREQDIKDALSNLLTELQLGRIEISITIYKEEVSFEEMREKDLARIMRENPIPASACISGDFSPSKSAARGKGPFQRKQQEGRPYTPPDDDDKIIYGRPVRRDIINIGDLTIDSGKVAVWGEIFFTELKKLNGKDKTVVTFEITDGTGSIRIVKVLPDEDVQPFKDNIKNGKAVVVQGSISYSKYDNDNIITPYAIIKDKTKARTDNAKEKRVELHLHTNMSAMDGLCDPQKVISLAQSMGHKAIAITDHGVAQAYPDAMNAAKALKKDGKDIKILYGLEAYCVNDIAGGIVKGLCGCTLDDEIIVFDLETTGLNPAKCEIIEIAAVKVKNGEIIDRYHTYVKPSSPIPYEITTLTGINDSMVSDSPGIENILPGFLEFCGNCPMCAHNADFDISFIKKACEKIGTDRQFCSIDTVELSRVLLPHLKKHRLNDIASEFNFTFKHHRAEDDTEVLAKIFFELVKMIKDKGLSVSIPDINSGMKALSEGQGDSTPKGRSYHLLILVKTMQGLRNLYELISASHLKYFKRHPLIPLSLLLEKREGLILGSACEAGELFTAVVQGRSWNELVSIAKIFDFLEIQPVGNNMFLVNNGTAKDVEQLREYNRTIVKLGKSLGKPVCATGDVHFIDPEDSIYREIIMTGMGFEDASSQAPLYFKTTGEMLEEFSYLGKDTAYNVVIKNTNMIADMCEDIIPLKDGTYPPSIENSAEEINSLARSKAAELYGEDLPPVVRDRLEMELNSIIGHGYDIMYIIAQKLVKKSLDDGYLVGSRGSVGSSVVAYFTGITEVNALPPHYRCPNCKHSIFDVEGDYRTGVDLPDMNCPVCGEKMDKDGFDIPFATFMGFKGDKTPDIDLNFSGEYQAQAHRETINLFGEENVFRAGTIGTVKSKTAYGFVKKYLEEKGKVLNTAEINRLVAGCTGIKRTTGQHPGGLIVLPKDRNIHEFTPVQHPADDVSSNIITTHFDYHSIHDNLLKLDLLGHDDPTMIRMLEDLSGLDTKNIPLDDKDTMRIFTSIDPLGIAEDDILEQTGAAAIPEFGTKNVRGMLVDTHPTTFDGLLRISGLSHGTNVWRNNAQDYILSGVATLNDVICVRDDITLYLIKMDIEPSQAFTISESVRKGKGLKPEWEELMTSKNVPAWYIESCKKIEYMFPRAHAVAYVMMAFRIAWFKVHRPLDFYAAYFTIRGGGFDASLMTKGDQAVMRKYKELKALPKRSAIEEDTMSTLEICHEFYKRGFSFTPVDIYKSNVKRFKIEGNTLIPPFTALSGVGESAAQAIVNARENGPFMSMEDIILRCDKVSKAVTETLGGAGALDGIPKTNQLSLFDAM
ncbi:MAG: PolC-type DNA polymerase III [Clostridiaceae bacterium]|nr:PolC-type DNA polymerase III [Clostridiaceae bacterium]